MASYNLTVNTQNNNINYTLFVYFQTDMDEEIIQDGDLSTIEELILL